MERRAIQFVSDKSAKTLDASTPRFSHIHISNVIARNAKIAAGFIYGLSELPIEDISLSDISISLAGGAEPEYPEMADGIEKMLQAGFFIRNARRIRLTHVEVSNQVGCSFDLSDFERCGNQRQRHVSPRQITPLFSGCRMSPTYISITAAPRETVFSCVLTAIKMI